MKKLMILAAVAFVAVASQAASTSWKVTAGNLKSYTGGASATAAYAGIVEIWASGGDLLDAVKVADLTPTSGTLNQKAFSTDKLTVGQTYTFTYYLNNGSYELTSTTKSTAAVSVGEPLLNWQNQATYTGNAGNWTAVPEPTSAMLLLLGFAGLALKRKQK